MNGRGLELCTFHGSVTKLGPVAESVPLQLFCSSRVLCGVCMHDQHECAWLCGVVWMIKKGKQTWAHTHIYMSALHIGHTLFDAYCTDLLVQKSANHFRDLAQRVQTLIPEERHFHSPPPIVWKSAVSLIQTGDSTNLTTQYKHEKPLQAFQL